MQTSPDSSASAFLLKAAWTRSLGEPFPTPGHLETGHEHMIDDGYWQGLPLGGLGSGSIGRTYRGDFARWHLDVGKHRYAPAPANQFCIRVNDGRQVRQTVLSSWQPDDVLKAWSWTYPAGKGVYQALFPFAVFSYAPDVLGVSLAVRQFSPVIPGNYRESSYPVGVFEYEVHNHNSWPVEVTLLFTWENGLRTLTGAPADLPLRNKAVRGDVYGAPIAGVILSGYEGEASESWHGSFAIGVGAAVADLTTRSRFVVDDGRELWDDFTGDGRLDDVGAGEPARPGERIGAGVAATMRLAPGERQQLPFVLAWDLPIVRFGSGTRWYRRYTRFLGRDGRHAWDLCRLAIAQHHEWARQIEEWQRPVLEAVDRPDWYKSALFNELYYLVDGGTAWEAGLVGSPMETPGHFGYLECFDYPFYETLDVRFYSSWALLMLWPEIEKRVIRDFAATVADEDLTPVVVEATGQRTVRKRKGVLPHDLGAPDEDPWRRSNAYHFQDVTIWKDLNAKFVLQVYRDYRATRDEALRTECWPAVKLALAHLMQFDRDGDGLPENEGVPDQTYDTWPMRGPSAYCSILWLAALEAAEHLARRGGEEELAITYAELRTRGQASLEQKLWNGRYYRFDALSADREAIMADQLCGQWYAGALDLPPVVPSDHARSALEAIVDNNVRGYSRGELGAVNGMRPLPAGGAIVDRTCDQSQEVWSGVTYALAALMVQEGMSAEALQTAWGAYNVVYQLRGLWFRTPEAWDENGGFRASMYMRPQAIWALEHALRRGADNQAGWQARRFDTLPKKGYNPPGPRS